MKKIIMLVLAVGLYANTIKVEEVVSVYDGDTFTVKIQSIYDEIGLYMPIRLNGVDTPEIRGKCPRERSKALTAKKFLSNILENGKVIELRDVKKGKYFRLIANLYVDGRNVGEEFIKAGLARPYNGGKRKGWCDDIRE